MRCETVREVEAIYRHFGIELTDEARAAMEDSHAESKKGPRAPKHTYSLADYGLTAAVWSAVCHRSRPGPSVEPSPSNFSSVSVFSLLRQNLTAASASS